MGKLANNIVDLSCFPTVFAAKTQIPQHQLAYKLLDKKRVLRSSSLLGAHGLGQQTYFPWSQFYEYLDQLNQQVLSKPYAGDVNNCLQIAVGSNQQQCVSLYRPQHDVASAVRKFFYARLLLDYMPLLMRAEFTTARQGLTEEEVFALYLAVICRQAGRENDQSEQRCPSNQERSAMLFALLAEQAGINDACISAMSVNMLQSNESALTDSVVNSAKATLLQRIMAAAEHLDDVRCQPNCLPRQVQFLASQLAPLFIDYQAAHSIALTQLAWQLCAATGTDYFTTLGFTSKEATNKEKRLRCQTALLHSIDELAMLCLLQGPKMIDKVVKQLASHPLYKPISFVKILNSESFDHTVDALIYGKRAELRNPNFKRSHSVRIEEPVQSFTQPLRHQARPRKSHNKAQHRPLFTPEEKLQRTRASSTTVIHLEEGLNAGCFSSNVGGVGIIFAELNNTDEQTHVHRVLESKGVTFRCWHHSFAAVVEKGKFASSLAALTQLQNNSYNEVMVSRAHWQSRYALPTVIVYTASDEDAESSRDKRLLGLLYAHSLYFAAVSAAERYEHADDTIRLPDIYLYNPTDMRACKKYAEQQRLEDLQEYEQASGQPPAIEKAQYFYYVFLYKQLVKPRWQQRKLIPEFHIAKETMGHVLAHLPNAFSCQFPEETYLQAYRHCHNISMPWEAFRATAFLSAEQQQYLLELFSHLNVYNQLVVIETIYCCLHTLLSPEQHRQVAPQYGNESFAVTTEIITIATAILRAGTSSKKQLSLDFREIAFFFLLFDHCAEHPMMPQQLWQLFKPKTLCWDSEEFVSSMRCFRNETSKKHFRENAFQSLVVAAQEDANQLSVVVKVTGDKGYNDKLVDTLDCQHIACITHENLPLLWQKVSLDYRPKFLEKLSLTQRYALFLQVLAHQESSLPAIFWHQPSCLSIIESLLQEKNATLFNKVVHSLSALFRQDWSSYQKKQTLLDNAQHTLLIALLGSGQSFNPTALSLLQQYVSLLAAKNRTVEQLNQQFMEFVGSRKPAATGVPTTYYWRQSEAENFVTFFVKHCATEGEQRALLEEFATSLRQQVLKSSQKL